MKVSLVLSCRVGDHTGVLPFMGQHGVLYVEEVATFLDAGMEVSSQNLKGKKINKTSDDIFLVKKLYVVFVHLYFNVLMFLHEWTFNINVGFTGQMIIMPLACAQMSSF